MLEVLEDRRVLSAVAEVEPNDTVVHAQSLGNFNNQSADINGSVGDGANDAKDVDFYKITLVQTTHLSLTVTAADSANLNAIVSLYNTDLANTFDPSGYSGHRLLSQSVGSSGTAALTRDLSAGTYYIAVSGEGNRYFFPMLQDSGRDGETGAYQLHIDGASIASPSFVLATEFDDVTQFDTNNFPVVHTPPQVLHYDTTSPLDVNADIQMYDIDYNPIPFSTYTSTSASELQITPSRALPPNTYQIFAYDSNSNLMIESYFTVDGVSGNTNGDAPDTIDHARDLGDISDGSLAQFKGTIGDNSDYTPLDSNGNAVLDPHIGNVVNQVDVYHFTISGNPNQPFDFVADASAGRIGSGFDPAMTLFRVENGAAVAIAGSKDALDQTAGEVESGGTATFPYYFESHIAVSLTPGDYYVAIGSGNNYADPTVPRNFGAGGVFDPLVSQSGTAGNSTGPYLLSVSATSTPPAITSADHATFTAGSLGTFTVTTTGTGSAAITRTGALPSGISFVDNGDGTATLSGTPAADTGEEYEFTITASNNVDPDATQTFTLTVNEAPSIFSVDHITFTVGSAGSFIVRSSGFPTAALSGTGAIPVGVVFTDNGDGTATLSGTPVDATDATYPLTLHASNGVGATADQSFTLTIQPASPTPSTDVAPTITSADHVAFIAGTAGSFTVTTNGTPVASLVHSGLLPSGVTFTDNGDGTATISGTAGAGAATDFPISIVASNGTAPDATQDFLLTVAGPRPLIIGPGNRGDEIQVSNADGSTRFSITDPFELGRRRTELRVASADLTGDGTPDIIVASGPGGPGQVATFDGITGDKLTGFDAFATATRGGAFVAAGDVNNDGTPDIVVGQGRGRGAQVRVFDGTDQSVMAEFSPFGMTNPVAVRVAVADVDGDGFADVIAAPGPTGRNAAVSVFDGHDLSAGNATMLSSFSPFGPAYTRGAFVATGDIDADGTPEIIVSKSRGRRSSVAVFDASDLQTPTTTFSTPSSTGVRIAVYDFNGDGHDDIFAATTVRRSSIISVISGADGSTLHTFQATGRGGVFVA